MLHRHVHHRITASCVHHHVLQQQHDTEGLLGEFDVELSNSDSSETEEADNNAEKSSDFIIQGHHFSLLQHETEKLRNEIEKMRSELRYEMDKVTAGQRLDLNLERG
ncbi:protein FMP32, mitochondrial [Trifolium repens]|nr:protein FMP32, mitochondrial [Trifolium repens]